MEIMELDKAQSLFRDLLADTERLTDKARDEVLFLQAMRLLSEEPEDCRKRSDNDIMLMQGLAANMLVYLLVRRAEAREMEKTHE